MHKISVILPCYNVEPYVGRAIQSLLDQQYDNLEVIAVDDGSVDDTYRVLLAIKKKDKRIKVLKQDNQGYGTAVNLGIKNSTGDYIAILEPDDYLDNDYYGPLVAAIQGLSADAVFYNSYFECRQGFRDKLVSLYMPPRFYGSQILSNDEICHRLILGNVGICFALYRKSFLMENNIYLDMDAKAYEDVSFVGSILNMSERVAVIAGGGYYYNRDIPNQSVTNHQRFASILTITQNFFNRVRLKPARDAAIRGYFLKHLTVYYKKTNSLELKSLLLKMMSYLVKGRTILAEDWVHGFLKSALSDLNYVKQNLAVTTKPLPDAKDLPAMVKVLNEGSYFQFLGFARYKLARALEENVPTANILNDIFCLLNVPSVEKNNMIGDSVASILSREDFFSLYRLNNSLSVKIIAKARILGIVPNLSVYCDIDNFSRFLVEDMTIISYPELATVKEIKPYFDFYNQANKNGIVLLKELYGKSIAIVGNSPCELNKRKGSDIDAHDVVIRFNNFQINQELELDYGKKTTIWACTPTLESLKLREDLGSFDFVITPKVNNYIPEFRSSCLLNMGHAGIDVALFDVAHFMRKYDMRVLSLGLLVILWLAENSDQFKQVSIYGFSLIDQLNGVKHYFSGDPSAGKQLSFHKWSKEALVLNSLIETGVIKKC